MAKAPAKPLRLSPWLHGVNQRLAPTSLPASTLREAVNVTLDRVGVPRRRAGYTRRLAGQVHSLWANADYLLAVLDGDLVRIEPDTWATTLLRAQVGSAPLSYAPVSNLLYYTSPDVCGRLDLLTGAHYPNFGPPNPEAQPTLGTCAGGLVAGSYQVAITYVSALGEESGSSLAVTLELTTGSGLRLTNLPQGDAAKIRIYCSMPNATSQELYRQAEVNMGITEVDIIALKRGRQLTTQFLEPLPQGTLLRYYRGRLYVVDGPVVYHSQPIHYGLFAPDDDYLPPFPADVGTLVAVEDGLYVGAGGTWFVQGGGPADFQQRYLSAETPIPGTAINLPAELLDPQQSGLAAYWQSPVGAVYAFPGGILRYPTQDTLPGTTATAGVSTLLRDGGVDRVVTVLTDATPRSAFGS